MPHRRKAGKLMSLAASRRALADANKALQMLEEAADQSALRVLWVASVVLLRTVGDALYKVDARSPAVRRAQERAYRKWIESGDPTWEFLRSERNALVHEHLFGLHMEPVQVVVDGVEAELDWSLFAPIYDGEYAGADGRDVLLGVATWWKEQLDIIESDCVAEG